MHAQARTEQHAVLRRISFYTQQFFRCEMEIQKIQQEKKSLDWFYCLLLPMRSIQKWQKVNGKHPHARCKHKKETKCPLFRW